MKRFCLNFAWGVTSIGVALEQEVNGKFIPITPYLYWPSGDAWDRMRVFLDHINWVSKSDAFLLMNQITEVINDWQDRELSQRADLSKVRERFPTCRFGGYY